MGSCVYDRDVEQHGRTFSVIRGNGWRWTKVPEYMSNGQRTARWFVDEKSREVRMAAGWRAPAPGLLSGATREFVLAIVDAAP